MEYWAKTGLDHKKYHYGEDVFMKKFCNKVWFLFYHTQNVFMEDLTEKR